MLATLFTTLTDRTPREVAKNFRPISYVMYLCDLLDLSCDLAWLALMPHKIHNGVMYYNGTEVRRWLLDELSLKMAVSNDPMMRLLTLRSSPIGWESVGTDHD